MPFGASSFWAIAVRARGGVRRAARSGRGNGGRGGGERASAERHAEEETLESCCVIVTIAFKHELLDHMLR